MAVVRLRGPLKQMAGERGLLRRHVLPALSGGR